jgi:hypothetical protein
MKERKAKSAKRKRYMGKLWENQEQASKSLSLVNSLRICLIPLAIRLLQHSKVLVTRNVWSSLNSDFYWGLVK